MYELPVRGVAPRISLGQNFLMDEGLLESLVECADVTAQDNVLEIGAGFGTFTEVLARRAKNVLALEIDARLEPLLRERLSLFSNVRIELCDALRADLDALCARFLPGAFRVVANLPYYITTPLMMRLLALPKKPAGIAVMVQKEVGGKMLALPGGKQYGPLAVFCQANYRVSVGCIVPAGAFSPPPKIDSAFMLLSPYQAEEAPPVPKDAARFARVVQAAFAMRRKTLQNNLGSAFSAGREATAAWIEKAGLPSAVRGEALTLAQFVTLSDCISSG